MLRRQRAIEIVPSSKPLRWRRYDVPQHLAPETSDALRFCAVEGDLDLLDRRHRSTIEAGSFVVSTGPPLASTAVTLRDWGAGASSVVPDQPAQGKGPRLSTVRALGSVAGHMSI